LLLTGWNSNRETENTSSRHIEITSWIYPCWWALWFYCRTWCERAWASHVSCDPPCPCVSMIMLACSFIWIY